MVKNIIIGILLILVLLSGGGWAEIIKVNPVYPPSAVIELVVFDNVSFPASEAEWDGIHHIPIGANRAIMVNIK